MSYCPLDLVESYIGRFVAYPSEHARVAHTLWIAHTHLIECFDTTPRLALMSAEPMSGKTRALEVSEQLVCDPLMGFSMSSAVTVRLVAERRRTVLFDEIDAVYGTTKRQEANGELVAFMNAGYRRGAKSYRCSTGNGSKHEALVFEAYAPLAVAGLRNLPDALATRAIIIRMRRRAPDEKVEPFRIKFHVPEAKPIREALEEWCCEHDANIACAEPALPQGIEDRAADIWEPLTARRQAGSTELLMSAYGTKRILRRAVLMSAFDPKRTSIRAWLGLALLGKRKDEPDAAPAAPRLC